MAASEPGDALASFDTNLGQQASNPVGAPIKLGVGEAATFAFDSDSAAPTRGVDRRYVGHKGRPSAHR